MHKHPRVRRWLARHPRYHTHFIRRAPPGSTSVERWFVKLTQKRTRRGSFTSVRDLVLKINGYIQLYNYHPRPFAWTKSTYEIFETTYAMCNDTSESRH